MDFTVSETVRDLTAAVRRFLDAEVLPVERLVLERGFGAAGVAIEELRGRVREMGLLAPHMPREWGGGGLPFLDLAPVSEVLGRSVIGHYVFNCQAPDAGNMEMLLQHGTPEQKERWLAPLVRGEIRSCFAMTEPENAGLEPRLARHHCRAARADDVRHRRPQVVHHRRRRRRLRDRHGGDRSRTPAPRAREP